MLRYFWKDQALLAVWSVLAKQLCFFCEYDDKCRLKSIDLPILFFMCGEAHHVFPKNKTSAASNIYSRMFFLDDYKQILAPK